MFRLNTFSLNKMNKNNTPGDKKKNKIIATDHFIPEDDKIPVKEKDPDELPEEDPYEHPEEEAPPAGEGP